MKRREFLRNSIFSAGAFAGAGLLKPCAAEAYAFSIVKDLISKAQAESAGLMGLTRNYLAIEMFGAPSRFVFDQWAYSNPGESTQANLSEMAHTKLAFSGGILTGSQPGYFQYRNLLVPHLFSTSVTTASGNKPMTSLLDNMAVIRGYGTNIDGHPTNAIRQIVPIGGLPSITGAVADGGSHLFSAVGYPDRGLTSQFISKRGLALNALTSGMPLRQLMEGFGLPGAERALARSTKVKYQAIYDRAMTALKVYADSESPGNKIVAQNMQNAQQLIQRGIANLEGFWSSTFPKYRNSLTTSARAVGLNGLSTGAMLNTAAFDRRMLSHIGNRPHGLPDNGYDMRQMIQDANIHFLAEGFTLAEYLIRENLSSAIELYASHMLGLKLQFQGVSGPEDVTTGSVGYDMHEWGSLSGIFLASSLFRGVGAMILQLKETLQALPSQNSGQNLWDETVVHIFGDFGRSARANGAGSDHGFNSMVSSLFSGAIKEPMVVGNVSNGGYSPNYPNAQGLGAPISGYNQLGIPTPVMMASTVSEVLRLPTNHWRNTAEPLLVDNGSRIVYAGFGKGKLVGGGTFG